MASGFFALLDDISLLMDSSANLTKVAAKNTAGVLGDDLAVNAAKASQFQASRELPVLWAITKGSIVNKIIIVPIMIALSYYFPQAIIPILMLGGLFLSYEGAHGIWGYIFPHEEKEQQEPTSEKDKIKSAIITDFILSIEIVLIALSTVADAPLQTKILVVSVVSILATIGVYSIVAFLVRLDDMGLALARDAKPKTFKYKLSLLEPVWIWQAFFLKKIELMAGFNALCNDFEAQVVCHRNNHINDRGIVAVGFNIPHK